MDATLPGVLELDTAEIREVRIEGVGFLGLLFLV